MEPGARVEEALRSFSMITEVPITFFDADGEMKWECHAQNKFCDFFDVYKDSCSVCRNNLLSSAKIASGLGEPYVFVCKAGLVKIAVSLIVQGQVTGCIMAGPIVMGGLKESTITNVFSLNKVHFESYPKIILFLKNMKIFKPKAVSHLADLLGNCILGAVSTNEDYANINKQYKELQRIGENLQKYKKENKLLPYPHELENQLIQHVKTGDAEGGLEILQKFLSEVSVMELGDLSSIKTKVLGICSILLAAEKSKLSQEQTQGYFDDMDAINQAGNFQELSVLAATFIDQVAHAVALSAYSGNSQIIKLAIRYINENYRNKISLKTIAAALHTNPSYLSMLFKRETEMTITDYLNKVRIKKSCVLLAETTMSLVDIATQCGFDDQSYFSKVFKKFIGITPKDYRRRN